MTYTVTAIPEAGLAGVGESVVTFNFDNGLHMIDVNMDKNTGVAPSCRNRKYSAVRGRPATHTVMATFGGSNLVFAPGWRIESDSSSPPLDQITQVINKNTVNLTLPSTTIIYGQTVNMVATVSPAQTANVPGSLNPTGDVLFTVDAAPEPYVAISPVTNPPASETSTLNLAGSRLLSAGAHTITASYVGTSLAYVGDTNYAASASATSATLTINADQSVVSFVPRRRPPSSVSW